MTADGRKDGPQLLKVQCERAAYENMFGFFRVSVDQMGVHYRFKKSSAGSLTPGRGEVIEGEVNRTRNGV